MKKRKPNWRRISIAVAVVAALGWDVHQANINTPKVTINRVAHVHKSSLIDHNNQLSNLPLHINRKLHIKSHASAGMIMDLHNGQILYQRNMHQTRKVASLAKLMTLYLVQRKAQQKHAWNQVVPINNNLAKLSKDKKDGLGGFEFKAHHQYTVKELYAASVIASSNNAAIALGQWVAGSNSNFVNLMNQQAKAWHLQAHFVSASGLENDDLNKFHLKVQGNNKAANKLSAHDLAIITRHLLAEYPQITNLSDQTVGYADHQKLNNENLLLKGKSYYDAKLDIRGLKSGYTPSAGYNFVALSAPKGHHDVVAITLNDPTEFSDLRSMLIQVYKKDHSLKF